MGGSEEETDDETEVEPEPVKEKKYKVSSKKRLGHMLTLLARNGAATSSRSKVKRNRRRSRRSLRLEWVQTTRSSGLALRTMAAKKSGSGATEHRLATKTGLMKTKSACSEHSGLMKWHEGPCTMDLNFVCES